MARATVYAYVLCGIASLIWAMVIWFVQIFFWLNTSSWAEVPLISLFIPTIFERTISLEPYDLVPGIFAHSWRWLEDAPSWVGLHKLTWGFLYHFPFALALFLFGIGLIWRSSVLEAKRARNSGQA